MTLKDLPFSDELSSSAMAAMHGGRMKIPGLPQVLGAPGMLAPIGPYGIDGFVLPEGAAD